MPVAISQDELDRRNQDKNKNKNDTDTTETKVDSRPLAKRILVRGSDGRLHVQFVDVDTGKKIPQNKIDNYRFNTANETKWTPTPNNPRNTKNTNGDDTKGEDKPKTKIIRMVDGTTKEVPLDWDGPGYKNSKESASNSNFSANNSNGYKPTGLSKPTQNTFASNLDSTTPRGQDPDNSDIGDNGEDISFAKPKNDNFSTAEGFLKPNTCFCLLTSLVLLALIPTLAAVPIRPKGPGRIPAKPMTPGLLI